MGALRIVVGAVVASLVVACRFDGGVPGDAVLFCLADGDCPISHTCDLVAHLCTSEGGAPVVTAASFQPAAAAVGIVTLTLEASAPVADVSELAFAPPLVDPGFSYVGTVGEPRAALVVDVSDAPEGFYPLVSATLLDADGRAATSSVSALLQVDRTPPRLERIEVSGGSDGIVADREGFDALQVRALVSEPVSAADAVVTVGTLRLPCVLADDALALDCDGVVPAGGGGTQDGGNAVLLSVADAAGNETTAQTSVTVDLAAPSIIAGSVTLTIDDDETATFASVGSVLSLRFLVNEPLAAPPVVELSGGEGHVLAVQAGESTTLFSLTATIDEVAVGAPELRVLTARLVDRAGHESDVVVPLPAPFSAGLRVLGVPESPCTIAPRADGSTCTDYDADGFFGPSAACAPMLLDCDDRDAVIHPGAPEIPGDGVANDCSDAGDRPLTEGGIFVDALAGDDDDDGTATAPVATLARALALVDGDGFVVLAADQTFTSPSTTIAVSLMGGRDPSTWERVPGARSEVTHGGACDVALGVDGTVVDAIDFRESHVVGGPLVRESSAACFLASTVTAMLIDIDVGFIELSAAASGTRVIGQRAMARVGGTDLTGVDLFFHRASVESRITAGPGAEVVVTSSVVRGNQESIVECISCRRVAVYHSNLLGDASFFGVDAFSSVNTQLVVVGNQIRMLDTASLVQLFGTSTLTMVDNLVDQVNGDLLQIDDADVVIELNGGGMDAFQLCDWPGCLAMGGNVLGDVSLLADDVTLDEGAGPSAARGRVQDAVALSAPTFVVSDAFGRCRLPTGAAAGAREP